MSHSPNTRRQTDFMKLVMQGYTVQLVNESPQNFWVTFTGPKETYYDGITYRVHVELPEQYPFVSPSIGFEAYTMFHPNVDERSGSVCLDVINQLWTPLYSLVNIFDVFLPQLLTYPNPADPLNSEAAAMFDKEPQKYSGRVKAHLANANNDGKFGKKDSPIGTPVATPKRRSSGERNSSLPRERERDAPDTGTRDVDVHSSASSQTATTAKLTLNAKAFIPSEGEELRSNVDMNSVASNVDMYEMIEYGSASDLDCEFE